MLYDNAYLTYRRRDLPFHPASLSDPLAHTIYKDWEFHEGGWSRAAARRNNQDGRLRGPADATCVTCVTCHHPAPNPHRRGSHLVFSHALDPIYVRILSTCLLEQSVPRRWTGRARV